MGHGHVWEKRIGLEDNAQAALIRLETCDVLTSEQYFPGGRRFETGNHLQGCRLAAAGGPQKTHKLAFVDR